MDGKGQTVDKLYIIIPAYNESENINRVIDEWYPVVEKHSGCGGSRLVIINDGSKDNTYEILCDAAKTHDLLIPMTKENGGHGPTLIFGYKYAIKNKADFVFQTDSDGQTDPGEFETFWKRRNRYDAIIGARLKRQDGRSRVFVEKTLLFILRLIFGVKIPDANAPFRLMKTGLLEKYLKKMPEDFNLPNVMLTTYFSYFHENIMFKEISFRPRQAGTNSINIKKIVQIGWKALGDFRKIRTHINDDQ